MRRGLSFILLLTILSPLAACRGDQQPRPAAETAARKCPNVEGSYFGSDKSSISRGEAVMLSWKIPREYGAGMKIEGLTPGEPPTISSFTAGPSNSPLEVPTPTEFDTGTLPAKPERTQTFTLKASGPEGCATLELPATVEVVEP